jgi:ABC-type lipoprotein release transport system permease subunit
MEDPPGARRNRAPGFWGRRELASGWKAVVALGLLAGVAGGVSLAAVGGARRTDAAFGRYKAATGAPDALVFGTQVGGHRVDYTPVKRLPEVADAGEFALAGIFVSSVGKGQLGALAPADSHLYRTLSRPLLEAGRLPDPDRVDEVVLNRNAASKYGLDVGDRVTIRSADDLRSFYGQAPPIGGPTIHARVVGIGDSTLDQVFMADEPSFFPSGALLERYGTPITSTDPDDLQVPRGRIAMATNLVVRLEPGTDLAAFHRDVARVLHVVDDHGAAVAGSQIPIRDLADDDKRIEHATDLEQIGLLLFAGATALASLVLVGQAIARAVYAMGEDVDTVGALGMVRLEIVRALVVPQLVVAALGAVVAVGVAIALSPLFPVGLAGRLDPDVGVHLDAFVVVPGAVLVALAVLTAATLAAWRATGPRRAAVRHRTSAVARTARSALPLSVGLGAGLALDRGRGARSLPTRPAIIGAVAAVTGVVACFGLLHGIDDALSTPSRSGQIWDATAYPSTPKDLPSLEHYVRRDPNVRAAGLMERAALIVHGTEIPVYTVTPSVGHRPFAVIDGRSPTGLHEVALGPSSARVLHRAIGDTVTLQQGGRPAFRATVTGLVLLPQTPHSSFDQGATVTPAAFTKVAGPRRDRYEDPSEEVTVVASFRHAPRRSVAAMHRATKVEVDPITTPQDVLNLRNVRPLPRALAGFLVLLGVAALGHALVTAVRRRRHELAVLRAMGFTPRQTATTICAQAATVALVGLAVGIPLGIVLGRLSWEWVADATPLVFSPPVAVAVVLLAIPVTLVVANLLAAAPARQAARLRPATVLRAE